MTSDVVLSAAALTLGVIGVIGFAKAIHHALNNSSVDRGDTEIWVM